MKMDEYQSAKLSFQIVIDKFYDTSFLAISKIEMVLALAKNREIENASTFLESNKTLLVENNLYDEASEAIEDMSSRLSKE